MDGACLMKHETWKFWRTGKSGGLGKILEISKNFGNFWRTGKSGGHRVKSGTTADPILLDEETEAITQGQRWFWLQQEAQLKPRLPWVHATLDT